MDQELKINSNPKIFERKYWSEAAKQFADPKMITIAALIVSFRVVVKLFKLNIASGLGFSLDGYVNSLGSMVYGPLVALLVGAISDILGLLITGQIGQFFLPFTVVEMTSSFIFALFFWRRRITVSKVLAAKFSVNLICNILMTSIFMKWLKYIQLGRAAADAYAIINGLRIAKNLIMFPLESMIITTVLSFALPVLTQLKLVDRGLCYMEKTSNRALYIKIALFTLLSIIIVIVFFALNEDISFDLSFKVAETIFSQLFE